jgi:hypothetical protein
MGFCGSCQNHNAISTSPPAPLLQIRRGYRSCWNTVEFQVEADAGQWTLRVKNSVSSEILYTAYRGGSRAAQSAAAEFAAFRIGGDGRTSPEQLAKSLKWQEYW